MERFIQYGFRAQNIPFYDCSVITRTREEWHAMALRNPARGIGFLIYGILIQAIYIPVMIAMWKRKKSNTCYQIMFILGLLDMLNLVINSELSGYFLIVGSNYCTSPNLNYIAGSIAVGIWCGACYCCLMLVLNRLCDLWDSPFSKQIFGEKAMIGWILGLIVYSACFTFFTPPVSFNSSLSAWFFSPFILGTETELAMFYNIPHTINNIVVVLITALLYIVLILVIGYKYGMAGMSTISQVRRSIMIQCVIICSLNLVGSFLYVYMQFFFVPGYFILISHFCWQTINGIPVLVYMTMNGTLRGDLIKMFRRNARIGTNPNSTGDKMPALEATTTYL